jgi:hypothetical protein
MVIRSLPSIITSVLPEAENKPALHLLDLLPHLARYTERYESASELFLMSDQILKEWREQSNLGQPLEMQLSAMHKMMHDPRREWSNIALRDSIMTVYHYGCVLNAITFKDCPTLSSMVDIAAIKAAKQLFQKSRFPNWENARHALSHELELVITPKDIERNATKGYMSDGFHLPNSNVMLLGVRLNDKMVTTLQDLGSKISRPITMECSKAALDHLIDTTNRIYLAFEPAAQKTFDMLQERAKGERAIARKNEGGNGLVGQK